MDIYSLQSIIENYIIKINTISTYPLIAIIGFTLLIMFIFHFFKRSFLLISILTLPATIMHELSHFILSFFLFGKPSKISVFPKKIGNFYQFGYVESGNINVLNVIPIAMAPFLLLFLGFYIFDSFALYEKNTTILAIELFLVANMLYGSIPSVVDFKLILTVYKPLIIVSIIVAIAISLYMFRHLLGF